MNQFTKVTLAIVLASVLAGCGDDKSASSPTAEKSSANPAAAPSAQQAPAQPAAQSVEAAAMEKQAVDLRNGANGVAQDSAKAFELFSKAAELGDRDAMFFVGIMYENGESVPVDEPKAVEWYTKSAEAGNGGAPERLKALKEKMSQKK
jgi:TPR repeat protein